jgi:hypothetical protein
VGAGSNLAALGLLFSGLAGHKPMGDVGEPNKTTSKIPLALALSSSNTTIGKYSKFFCTVPTAVQPTGNNLEPIMQVEERARF